MSVPKVIRDGKVAVLVSYGFGAGWSTWADNSERAVFSPEIVEWVEDGKKGEPPLPDDLAEEYAGGLDGVRVEWVHKGDRFTIDEYDGSEKLHIIGPDYGYVA